jgi:hypothetical protein
MTMKTVIEILVDGKVTLTINGEIRSDGTIWGPTTAGITPIINGFLLKKAGISAEEFGKASRAGRYTPEMLACSVRMGDNPGGRFARDKSAAEREATAERESAMSPIDREKRTLRQEIANAERRAARCDRSKDDVEFQRLTWKAEDLQSKFYARFPEELRSDKADDIRARAERRRDLAAGAMSYDCDGSLSHDDQCQRRDEMLLEAAKLEAQAENLEKVGA